MSYEDVMRRMNTAVGTMSGDSNSKVLLDSNIVDLRYLSFSYGAGFSASTGTFLKCVNYNKYYKLSSFNDVDGEYGYESVCEVISNMVCDKFNFNYLKQDLIHARIKISGHECIVWLVQSDNYKEFNERRITLETLCALNSVNKNDKREVFDFIKSKPFKTDILNMMLVDYIIYNRDRHGANIELLCKPNGDIRLAPIFLIAGVRLLHRCFMI